jgi:hypothetical protein
VSAPEEREQNWYPVSQVGWFTAHIREGIAVTGHQLELLQPAPARPGRLDDATVARIIRVHQDQAGDLVYFQNQADKWKGLPDLTAAQRAAVAGYEAALAQLRQVNSDVLAAADQLTRTTARVFRSTRRSAGQCARSRHPESDTTDPTRTPGAIDELAFDSHI